MHPPKKACNSGRIPLASQLFEDMKEADLYGYNFDPKKQPGCQDPWSQRPGAEKSGGRELRTRRARDMLDSAAPSEEDEEDGEGRPSRRQRKPPRKFDGTEVATGATPPKKHNGWGGARKKGVSRFVNTASETPEPDSRPVKRARTAAASALHQRLVRESVRESSVATTSGDEGSSTMDVEEYVDSNTKRGRPPGSKNAGRRSDYGIKKGPRKKNIDATTNTNTPVPSAHGPNAPPPALQSLSAGQGQFSIDPQPSLDAHPSPAPNSAETVFQATPQPAAAQDSTLVHPSESSTPDAYMLTAPLSQYTNNQGEEAASASGSRRKPRVKSEKRSQSMTIWWAERKARKKEQDEKEGKPPKPSTSRSNSSSGRRGGRAAGGQSATATPAFDSTVSPSDVCLGTFTSSYAAAVLTACCASIWNFPWLFRRTITAFPPWTSNTRSRAAAIACISKPLRTAKPCTASKEQQSQRSFAASACTSATLQSLCTNEYGQGDALQGHGSRPSTSRRKTRQPIEAATKEQPGARGDCD